MGRPPSPPPLTMTFATEMKENTYAVMVHKLYAERVREFLLTPAPSTKSSLSLTDRLTAPTQHKATTVTAGAAAATTTTATANTSTVNNTVDNVQILDTQALTGVSLTRRGYILLLLPECQRSITALSPMARQQISWIGQMSRSMTVSVNTAAAAATAIDDSSSFVTAIATAVWKNLLATGFTVDDSIQTPIQSWLRIDVHPRCQGIAFIQQLQLAAYKDCCARKQPSAALDATDLYAGPAALTKSRSKCTHRLTIVLPAGAVTAPALETGTEPAKNCLDSAANSTCYWGVEERSKRGAEIDVRLNHEASKDVKVVPCDNQTGDDLQKQTDPTVPLSRAYYKLAQVWEEYLSATVTTATTKKLLLQGAGLDLGASPGGWTQVLAHLFGMPRIVAVDPGKVAARVTQLPAVTYLQSHMEKVDLQQHGPFSVVVCDASLTWRELLTELSDKVVQSADWCLPSLWIVTMKMPFKSIASVQRHVEALSEFLPLVLGKMAQTMYPGDYAQVRIKHRVVHLMANSDSERTVIALFDKKETAE